MILFWLIAYALSAISFVVLYRVVSPAPTRKNTKTILWLCIPPFTLIAFILTLLLIFRDIYLYRVQLEQDQIAAPEQQG